MTDARCPECDAPQTSRGMNHTVGCFGEYPICSECDERHPHVAGACVVVLKRRLQLQRLEMDNLRRQLLEMAHAALAHHCK